MQVAEDYLNLFCSLHGLVQDHETRTQDEQRVILSEYFDSPNNLNKYIQPQPDLQRDTMLKQSKKQRKLSKFLLLLPKLCFVLLVISLIGNRIVRNELNSPMRFNLGIQMLNNSR